jgi:acyl carrier protein
MENFLSLFTEILEREEKVKLSDKFRNYPEWDSLSILALLAMINEEYDVIIPRKEFDEMITIEDIVKFIKK